MMSLKFPDLFIQFHNYLIFFSINSQSEKIISFIYQSLILIYKYLITFSNLSYLLVGSPFTVLAPCPCVLSIFPCADLVLAAFNELLADASR